MITYILFLFILMIVISLREGFVIRWALNGHREKDSDIWHALGGVMRVIPALVLVYAIWPDWMTIILIVLLWSNWAWTVYDAAINLINGWPIYYQGKSSYTEKIIIKQLIWMGKAVLLLVTVAYSLFYFELI